MMLSDADIERLERIGYDRLKFARFDGHGFVRLRNRGGFCVFYDVERRRCGVYERRPLGCRIYPVIYSEQEGIVLDPLCPMRSTVSRIELGRKGKNLMELLQRIDVEAACNRSRMERPKRVE
jgi:Fe-S-cluster containining protein